jgi:transcriptional regulator with XRE-family HTH domain
VEAQLQTLGLRAARKRAGLGLEPCARKAGVTVRLLLAYEMGRQKPGIANAARLARALDVRVDQIEEFTPAVREVEAAGFELAEADERSSR